MFYLLLTILIPYVALIVLSLQHWRSDKEEASPLNYAVSVVIVARNEEDNICATIDSILGGSHPIYQLEIIVVDDHSEDRTTELVLGYDPSQVRLFQLTEFDTSSFGCAFKKAAQYIGITQATHDIIMTTDGDCICPPEWIEVMLSTLSNKDVVTGPISFSGSKSVLHYLQQFDVIATMLLTNLGIRKKWWLSANAANMAFRKSIYLQYAEHMSFEKASGDDILLLQFAFQNNYKIDFASTGRAIVSTPSQLTTKTFLNQRLRWASKSGSYLHNGVNYMWGFLFVISLVVALSPLLLFILGYHASFFILIFLSSKMILDFFFLRQAGKWFDLRHGLGYVPLIVILHAVYVVVVGIFSLFSTGYNWKGRRVR